MTCAQTPPASARRARFATQGWPLLLACLPFSPAAEEQTRLEPVLVYERAGGTPTLPDIGEARERINRTAGGVDIVDAEAFRRGRASTLQDVLGYSAGVFVQPRFGSDEARLSIRGSGLQRTFHLRGIRLLQDGVPLNLADGGGDFQTIDPLATRYVEVFRGANALQFGASNLGGAINFVSPSGRTAAPVEARMEIGGFGYQRGHLAFAHANDQADAYLSYTHANQDGFRQQSEQDNDRLSGNVGIRLGDAVESRFFVFLNDSKSKLPGGLTRQQLADTPSRANPASVALNQKRDYRLARVSNRTVWQGDDERIEASVFYSTKSLHHPIFQVLEIDSEDYGLFLRYDRDDRILGRRNNFSVGFMPVRGTSRDERFRNIGGSRGQQVNDLDQTAVNLELFFENRHEVLTGLDLVAGLQLAHASRRQRDLLVVDNNFPPDGRPDDESIDAEYFGVNPKIGMLYRAREGVDFFANVSRVFEPPSFAELFPSGRVNRGIVEAVEAQRGTSYEIGTRGALPEHGLQWDVSYYHAALQNELLTLTDLVTNASNTINAGETMHQGIEFAATWRPWPWLRLEQAWQWNDFRFRDDPVFGNNRLAGIPEHLYRGQYLYEHPRGWYIGPTVEWVPVRAAVDFANTTFADGYGLLGVKMGGPVLDSMEWFVEGRNLTDARYAATTAVVRDARTEASQAFFLPGDGASVFAGLTIRL
jgi:iron complex outermembrane recepter protein